MVGEGAGGGHYDILSPMGGFFFFPSPWSLKGWSEPRWDCVCLNENTSDSRRVETGWVEGGELDY